MDKTEAINEVLKQEEQLQQIIVPTALKVWRNLNIPIAQLKSLFIIVAISKINFSSLAQELGVTRGNVTGIIERLEEQGLVCRKPDPKDRRTVWLQPTDEGQKIIRQLTETRNNNMMHILELMSIDDLNAMAKGISAFACALDEYQKEYIHENDKRTALSTLRQ